MTEKIAAHDPGSDPAPVTETTPVTDLPGVGSRLAERLQRLRVRCLRDLLLHLPSRYEDRTRVVPIASLELGMRGLVEAEIVEARVHFGRRRALLLAVADPSGQLRLRFFHFSRAQQAALAPGTRVRLFGEVRDVGGVREMVHPEYRTDLGDDPPEPFLTPIYPVTEGVGQLVLRRLIGQLLPLLDDATTDLLPEHLSPEQRQPWGGLTLSQALLLVHRPPADVDRALLESGHHPAQRRLALEELLAHHLSLRRLRRRLQRHTAPNLATEGRLSAALWARLPFRLTAAQKRVLEEMHRDLGSGRPMQRLLQGDVGSGKTLVAAGLVLHCVEAGLQAAVMAPTELLAEQHLHNFRRWLDPLDVRVVRLSGRQKGSARDKAMAAVESGQAQVVVGTHALFQEQVRFRRLGLVVIDEQHRFGVHQRMALRDKGRAEDQVPHQLIMTATPIPRTLTMTAYADLDVSVIDQLPPGRTPVRTAVVPESRRVEVIDRVRRACRGEGRQAYWVCTLIEESDQLQAEAAEATAERLAGELPELRIGLVHGRLGGKDKASAMQAFAAGETDLLVATTVIEVGVDVPRASLMVIENAERLGLAQLHQLRGRVGRGAADSYCVLLYRAPLSELSRRRLAILRDTDDGFAVARADLELRGPGEVLGTRQTGLVQLRVADLLRDRDLLAAVERVASGLLVQHPERVEPIIERWIEAKEELGEV